LRFLFEEAALPNLELWNPRRHNVVLEKHLTNLRFHPAELNEDDLRICRRLPRSDLLSAPRTLHPRHGPLSPGQCDEAEQAFLICVRQALFFAAAYWILDELADQLHQTERIEAKRVTDTITGN
jgi:hypothetical protein